MLVHTILYRSVPIFSGSVTDYLIEIDRILDTSRQRNGTAGITGALLFNEDRFVQVLEGDKAAVTDTYKRILLDPRHEEVELLFDSSMAQRRLPEWSMAFVGDAPAIRQRFAKSPLAAANVTMRGEDLVDFMVALTVHEPVSGASTSFGAT